MFSPKNTAYARVGLRVQGSGFQGSGFGGRGKVGQNMQKNTNSGQNWPMSVRELAKVGLAKVGHNQP